MAILGPMATEPAMVSSQLQQVELLEEEMGTQQPNYEQFINSGVAVADKCEQDSEDAEKINKQIEEVSGWSWDKICKWCCGIYTFYC